MIIRVFFVFPHGGIEAVWSGRYDPRTNQARGVWRALATVPQRGRVARDASIWTIRRDGRTVQIDGPDLTGPQVGAVWREDGATLVVAVPAD